VRTKSYSNKAQNLNNIDKTIEHSMTAITE